MNRIMNRRSLVALPGIAALAASRVFAQTHLAVSSEGLPLQISKKTLMKHSGSKSAYKLPKNAAKQTKYLDSLSVLLSLTSSQQQQAAAILTNAASAGASIHIGLKAARKALHDAVIHYDAGGISQTSSALGVLTGQQIANGASANAAMFQVLTPDQQAKLSQFQG